MNGKVWLHLLNKCVRTHAVNILKNNIYKTGTLTNSLFYCLRIILLKTDIDDVIDYETHPLVSHFS